MSETFRKFDIAYACTEFDGTCRGSLIFSDPVDLETSVPRCHRHHLLHRAKLKQELKTL